MASGEHRTQGQPVTPQKGERGYDFFSRPTLLLQALSEIKTAALAGRLTIPIPTYTEVAQHLRSTSPACARPCSSTQWPRRSSRVKSPDPEQAKLFEKYNFA
ncbi:hypothetical protein BDV06DRAFT_226120 [Aspergillus oleicola]